MITRTDALNDALERLDGLGFEMRPGFSSHGPMGSETFSALGQDDTLADWVETYKSRHLHFELPTPTNPVDLSDESSWRNALGDMSRVSDWAVSFRGELGTAPWSEVVSLWVSRFLKGYAGGLTHGLIRTTHAVRMLETEPAAPSTLMLEELANGLAYWAARFTALPGTPQLAGSLDLGDALQQLPRHIPDGRQTLKESGSFIHLRELPGFVEVVEGLGPPTDLAEAFSDLTATFCKVLVAHGELAAVPLVHLVTPTAGIRTLTPYLSGWTVAQLYAQIWHVNASILAAFTRQGEDQSPIEIDAPAGPDEVLARAVEHRDTHVMKFARACTSEYALRPDPIYLQAAEALRQRMPAW